MNKQQTVFVGLSGGVDSSVAALRLLKQGYNVVGVFIKVWHPDFMICNWQQERLDAMRVAAHLNIPFLTCDAEAAYRDNVATYFIDEYKAGRTPNPDVMCNQHVKFGAFLDFALRKGADFIATGHYAQRIDNDETVELHRGVDPNKDQTYFLWTLSNEQLKKSLFPVGDTPKEEIRREAAIAGIPTATKKDSQGICFLGHVDIPEFLSHYVDLQPGKVLNEAGEEIGEHQGALVYTLGQRHGFTINTHDTDRHPMFVIGRDLEANAITVGPEKIARPGGNIIKLNSTVLRSDIAVGDKMEMQYRYRQQPIKIAIVNIEKSKLELKTETETELPAAGQSCVLYRDTHCIGGGMIE